LLKKQEREIRDLKLELAMHDTLAGRGRITYDPYTPEEQKVQEDIALKYLEGESEDIQIESLRQVKELFIQMRNKYKWLANDIKTN
jgi:kinesin family protein 6/9